MAALIAGLAGQAGGLQQQAIAGGFNTANNWMSNQTQLNIARLNNEQQKWNFQNREQAYTEAGLPRFLSYQSGGNDLGGMVPQTYSHLGGSNFQRTGVMGGSFRGLTGSNAEQMFGLGREPSTRVPPPGLMQDNPPSYDSIVKPSGGNLSTHSMYKKYGDTYGTGVRQKF
jgi:hypothetical protein